jgi:hypothetical protein
VFVFGRLHHNAWLLSFMAVSICCSMGVSKNKNKKAQLSSNLGWDIRASLRFAFRVYVFYLADFCGYCFVGWHFLLTHRFETNKGYFFGIFVFVLHFTI